MILINKISSTNFNVKIIENNSNTNHLVTLTDDYYFDITNNSISKKDLIKKSFIFLLERESKESILPQFDLRDISKYFPDYEKIINN